MPNTFDQDATKTKCSSIMQATIELGLIRAFQRGAVELQRTKTQNPSGLFIPNRQYYPRLSFG